MSQQQNVQTSLQPLQLIVLGPLVVPIARSRRPLQQQHAQQKLLAKVASLAQPLASMVAAMLQQAQLLQPAQQLIPPIATMLAFPQLPAAEVST